jgi:hypothetical protein
MSPAFASSTAATVRLFAKHVAPANVALACSAASEWRTTS